MTTWTRWRQAAIASALLMGLVAVTACSPQEQTPDAVAGSGAEVPAVWDSNKVHSIEIEYEQADYDALIAEFIDSGDKVWIHATVTIDGTRYTDVGFKLKGNSSLIGLSDNPNAQRSSDRPQELGWIINLDKFVDGQHHGGAEEFAVRSNPSATSLNEALALDLLDLTGLAAQQAIPVLFTANGSPPALRLVVENPNTDWMERELGEGYLYKAELGGDYTYRGEDPDAYGEVFDQEGGEDNVQPLIDFLKFINEASDADFESGLADWLDVEAFATYLAFQELVHNADDIDGPGNNSYLYWDLGEQRMTVVNWDLNLAFGGSFRGDSEAGEVQGGRNVLATRFMATPEFEALYRAELDRLRAELINTGTASEMVNTLTNVLLDGASGVLDPEAISQESDALQGQLQP